MTELILTVGKIAFPEKIQQSEELLSQILHQVSSLEQLRHNWKEEATVELQDWLKQQSLPQTLTNQISDFQSIYSSFAADYQFFAALLNNHE